MELIDKAFVAECACGCGVKSTIICNPPSFTLALDILTDTGWREVEGLLYAPGHYKREA